MLIGSSYANSHFIVLGFTTSTGMPIHCFIAMACQEVEAKHIMELQPRAVVQGELTVTENLEANSHGKDMYDLPVFIMKMMYHVM